MTWNTEILKPEITFVPSRPNASGVHTHGTFNIKITFVGNLYPVLEYTGTEAPIELLQASQDELFTKLQNKITEWKNYHDFLSSKQTLVDNALNSMTWGA